MNPIAEGMIGAARAVWWAATFYVIHAWPLAALVGLPAIVRMAAAVRSPHPASSNLSTGLGLVSTLLRVTLFLVVASIDMAPDAPWYQSLWPGIWTQSLASRFASMSGRIDLWIWMGLWAALATLVIMGVVKVLTLPAILRPVFQVIGVEQARATRWAEAVALGAAGLITLPMTSLILYAAVARAGYCLHP
jgi:hypothetical protein